MLTHTTIKTLTKRQTMYIFHSHFATSGGFERLYALIQFSAISPYIQGFLQAFELLHGFNCF